MAEPDRDPPPISDHELLGCVGRGSYGEVWLARNVIGTFRAVKIVYRRTFTEDRPFEREFLGIQKFEPVSRSHPGLVSVLHVGRHEPAGCFYYVMEVADDVSSGQAIDPARYVPRTLAGDLSRRGRLPIEECVSLSLALASALGCLHGHGLIHRDIKPSNIIFVKGQPKFADIGLVTEIGESVTHVGTTGYLAPEGPGSPPADIYSLGKVIYEMAMGKGCGSFPELPSGLGSTASTPALLRLNQIILRACEPNPLQRYQSAEALHQALTAAAHGASLTPALAAPPARRPSPAHAPAAVISPALPPPDPGARRIAILYRSNLQPDERLLEHLVAQLGRRGCRVFCDKRLTIGVNWALEIETNLRQSDAVIVLLSAQSAQSEMIAYEVETAWQAAQRQHGRPRLLPVRIGFTDPLPAALARVLAPLHYFLWQGTQDDGRLVEEILRAIEEPTPLLAAAQARPRLESIGGAVPLDSRFYVVRPSDREFHDAIGRRDSIVLVKGARQMGKTSLLARGLQPARESGARVVLTDFQKLNATHLASVEALYLTLGEFLADQLGLDVFPGDCWDRRRSPNTNFERYLRRQVLGQMTSHLVWGLDEVDRLFSCDFGSEVFGLFRSWHNERALDPTGPWSSLTLAIAYATEAHLFITDINQSPFNVGTRLALDDFSFEQVADLNQRYGAPLPDPDSLHRFFELLCGQPYLVRRGLHELASGNLTFAELVAHADRDEGLFGDHLRRMLVLLAKDPELQEVVRGVLRGQPCPDAPSFYRLRSAGVVKGDSPHDARLRCGIYAAYLRQHLA